MRRFLKSGLRVLRYVIFVAGCIFMLMAVLAFTRIPFDMHRWLGETGTDFKFKPDVIVMLGGSGMPSESNLIRLFYTSHLSTIYPESEIIIAHPLDYSVAMQMKNYLMSDKVDSSRISLMMKGTNTREQAMELIDFKNGIENKNTLIVTSPENMYRTLRVFRKLNFKNVGGVSTFENAMFVDLKYNHKKVGGQQFAPDVSENLDLRYNFWNYLKLEITCLREYVAIVYYKLNSWI